VTIAEENESATIFLKILNRGAENPNYLGEGKLLLRSTEEKAG
jgi:hypothetical protein